jgi:hypothetical protein
MRLRVKTLTRRTFGLDVSPSASIDELKARLTQETGIPLAGQKLVYKGEVLHSGCVQDHCIADDEFLVVIVVGPAARADAATKVSDAAGQTQQGSQGLDAPSKRPHDVLVSDLPPRAADLSAAASVPVQLSELMHALASFSSAPSAAAGRQLPPQLSPLLSAPAGMRPEGEEEDEEHVADEHDEGDEEDEEDEDGEEEEEEEDDDGVDGEEEDEEDDDPDDLQWSNAEALQQLIDMGFPENRFGGLGFRCLEFRS